MSWSQSPTQSNPKEFQSFDLLSIFRILSTQCSQLSIQAFVKGVYEIHGVCYIQHALATDWLISWFLPPSLSQSVCSCIWWIHSHTQWGGCQSLFSLRSYLPTQGYIVWPELMSFNQFHPSSIMSLELCLGMFDHTQHSGWSSVWSLRITTVQGKVPLHVPTGFHYKTEDNHWASLLCVHILSTCPSGVSLRVGVALS